MADLPKDPMILLSVVNTKLRDFYADLDTLCQEMRNWHPLIMNMMKG